MGYNFTIYYLQQQQTQVIQQKLNNTLYDEASLIEITVPLSLPYYNNWTEFERYDGQIEVDGITYTFVKRKIQDGQLILKCLPNNDQQKIKKQVSDWFAGANGFKNQPNDKNDSPFKNVTKTISSEYEVLQPCSITSCNIILNTTFYTANNSVLTTMPSKIAEQPPEVVA